MKKNQANPNLRTLCKHFYCQEKIKDHKQQQKTGKTLSIGKYSGPLVQELNLFTVLVKMATVTCIT